MALPNHSESDTILQLHEKIDTLTARLDHLEKDAISVRRIFHPAVGLICGLGLTLAFALACFYLLDGQELIHFLSYNVPMAVPFTGFVFDRALRYFGKRGNQAPAIALDGVVLLFALLRAVYPLPVISGHALFLSYALITVKSNWARLPVMIVLAGVAYFKIMLWHDPTLLGGAVVGVAAALLWRGLRR